MGSVNMLLESANESCTFLLGHRKFSQKKVKHQEVTYIYSECALYRELVVKNRISIFYHLSEITR